jgi:hypothetical protein
MELLISIMSLNLLQLFFFFCVTLGEISNHNKKLFVKNYLMLFMIMMTTKLMIDGATVSIVRGDI